MSQTQRIRQKKTKYLWSGYPGIPEFKETRKPTNLEKGGRTVYALKERFKTKEEGDIASLWLKLGFRHSQEIFRELQP